MVQNWPSPSGEVTITETPAKVSKVRAHLSKSQVMVVWLSVEWRRGEEIVDNIVWQVAERAVEDKELRENGENKQQLHST